MALVIVCCTSGCYWDYPKIPTARPKVIEGERVEMDAERHSYSKKCNPRDADCGLSKSGEWQKRASYTTVVAKYHGQPLTQFELRSLVDPKFEEKIAHIRSRKGLCNLSLVPSVIGIIGMGVAIYGLDAKDRFGEDGARTIQLAGAAAGIGGALGSWALGGFACTKAKEEYAALFPGTTPDERSLDRDRDNAAYLEEMAKLTESFNQRFQNGPSPDPEPEEPTQEGAASE